MFNVWNVKRFDKPWGHEVHVGKFNGWRVKLLVVNDGHRTSLQYHREKLEYWFTEEGLRFITPGEKHRLTGPAVVLEVAKGSDEDIVRVEDDYGRV